MSGMKAGQITQLAALRRVVKGKRISYLMNDSVGTNVRATDHPDRPYVCLNSVCMRDWRKATSCRHVVAARLFDRMHPGRDEAIAHPRELGIFPTIDPKAPIDLSGFPCWGCGKPVDWVGAYYCKRCDPAIGGDAAPLPFELTDEQRAAETERQNDAARRRMALPEGRRQRRR